MVCATTVCCHAWTEYSLIEIQPLWLGTWLGFFLFNNSSGQVELFELIFAEFSDTGGGHESVLVLGCDELDVPQVGGLDNVLLFIVTEPEADAEL